MSTTTTHTVRTLTVLAAVVGILTACTAPDDEPPTPADPLPAPTDTTTPAGSAVPIPRLTPAGVLCGVITDQSTQTSLPVAVLVGSVDCHFAVLVADHYLNDPAIDPQGVGRAAIVDSWACHRPHPDDRTQTFYACTDPTGINTIRIGD